MSIKQNNKTRETEFRATTNARNCGTKLCFVSIKQNNKTHETEFRATIKTRETEFRATINKTMPSPSIQDYKDSFLSPSDYFPKWESRNLQAVYNPDFPSEPYFEAGGLASVFKFRQGDKLFAAKCFTKDAKEYDDNGQAYQDAHERARRFLEIAKQLKKLNSPYFIDYQYYTTKDEILWVCSQSSGDGYYPCLVMEWIEGETLGKYVRRLCVAEDKAALSRLFFRFVELACFLAEADMAHGDLKHDNMMVTPRGELILIDYDGMYVPSLAGSSAKETGSPANQHPLRERAAPFDRTIDDFSLLVLAISLLALREKPSLYASFHGGGDGLIFNRADFLDMGNAAVFRSLVQIDEPHLRSMLARMQQSLNTTVWHSFERLPELLQPALWYKSAFLALKNKANAIEVNNLGEVRTREAIQKPKPPARYTETINGVSFDMIYIPEGTFLMGSPKTEVERSSDETQHQVTLSAYYMGETQVTQELWEAVMGKNPSYFEGNPQNPVEQVSWDDCQDFIKILNEKTGKKYGLPTEAQWEYAARAGTTTPFHIGNNLTTEQANYNGDYPYNGNAKGIHRGKTTPVKTFAPNAWGLYDVHGNVWEWCADWYGGDYPTTTQTNPTGAHRVIRGGSWRAHATNCRLAIRYSHAPDNLHIIIGWRLCAFL